MSRRSNNRSAMSPPIARPRLPTYTLKPTTTLPALSDPWASERAAQKAKNLAYRRQQQQVKYAKAVRGTDNRRAIITAPGSQKNTNLQKATAQFRLNLFHPVASIGRAIDPTFCARRAVRAQVLFALRRTGKGRTSRAPKHFNIWSKHGC